MKANFLLIIGLLSIMNISLKAQMKVIGNGNVGIGAIPTPVSMLELAYNKWIRLYIENNPGRLFPDGQPMAKVYTFSPDARAFFYKWQAENAKKVNAAGDSLLSEELNKFDVHYLRFALILEIMEGNKSCTISLKAAENSAKICKYFEYTMYMVLEKLESSESNTLDMKKVSNLLLEKGITQLETARITGLSQATISRNKI